MSFRRLLAALLATGTVVLGAGAAPPAGAAPAADGPLVGTLTIDAGRCAAGVTGSYLRMILPTGTPAGPFLDNDSSSCGDKSYTPLTAGTDGGLVTGGYQPAPSPRYDGDGNSLAARINQPVSFFGVRFSTSTNPTDLQSGAKTPAPSIRVAGGRLSGDLSAVVATWNEQEFNQGSPKPDGSRPGNTTPVAGTYDAATGRYSLQWTSQIVGGPFNDFTGLWHLEGTFRPAGAAPAAASTTTVPSGATSSGATDPGATTGGTTAPGAAAASTTTTAPSAQVAAPVVEGEPVVVSRNEVQDGWRAPTWAIVAIGILGVAAALVLVRPDRRSAS